MLNSLIHPFSSFNNYLNFTPQPGPKTFYYLIQKKHAMEKMEFTQDRFTFEASLVLGKHSAIIISEGCFLRSSGIFQ